MRVFKFLAFIAAVLVTGAGAVLAQPAAEPPIIPVRRFVANIDVAGDYRLSPDGEKLLWTESIGARPGLVVRSISGVETRKFPLWRGSHTWLADSRHVLILQDTGGAENTQINLVDTDIDGAKPRNITPWPGSRSLLVSARHVRAGWFYFQSNRRLARVFDLFEAEIATGDVREVERNPGDVVQWVIDAQGQLGGRIRNLGAQVGSDRALEVRADASTWREVFRWDGHTFYSAVHSLDLARGVAVIGTNRDQDKAGLFKLALKGGALTKLFVDARVDYSVTHTAFGASEPFAVRVDPHYSETHFLDPAIKAELDAALAQAFSGGSAKLLGLRIGPADAALRRFIVYPQTNDGTREMLFDRVAGSLTTLRDSSKEAETAHLTHMRPISYPARDGRTLHGYFTQPKHLEGKPTALVMLIHGGPWARYEWGGKNVTGDYSRLPQFLANRGYSVLQVNYRSSTGYGREHLDAGARELGGKTQDDIEDGVSWAVAQGLADPKRIAVYGASFGGYSTLMQLVRSPEKYACGVSIVGVSNWVRQIESQPPYWASFRHVYDRFYGDPAKPEDRVRLMAQSPVSQVEKIRAPLLLIHGANDVRVLAQDSEDVERALKAAGKPVEMLVFADEGHSIRKWQNQLKMYRKVEEFFAKCLGGRDGGFDFFQLGAGG